MILLGTFISIGASQMVPKVTVVQIKTPEYIGSLDGSDRTRETCERLGELYKISLIGELPSGTKLVITCLPERGVLMNE